MTGESNNLKLAERELDEALELSNKLGLDNPEVLSRLEIANTLALMDIAASLRKIASRMNGK